MSETAENTTGVAQLKRALEAIKSLRAKVENLEAARKEPIAVIGMACRFPGGARDPESFWQLLQSGTDAVTKVPPERWDADAFYDPDPEVPGKAYCRTASFIRDVDQFDAAFF